MLGWRYRAIFLATVVGCGSGAPSRGGSEPPPDASLDPADGASGAGSSAPDATGAGAAGSAAIEPVDPALCQVHEQAMREFVASHRDCTADGRCNIIGSCSAGLGFWAVNDGSNQRAQAMSDATPADCKLDADGPTYDSVCDQGLCVAVANGGSCGEAPGPSEACPYGRIRYGLHCPASSSGVVPPGCYQRCDEDGESVCDPGFVCQASATSSCDYAPADGCMSCEPRSTSLCMPAADCALLLSLAFEGKPSATFGASGELGLQFWAENIGDEPVAFEIAACAAPQVQGLTGYDLFDGCSAGCDQSAPRAFSLMPGARAMLAQGSLARAASACNPGGIAPGRYALAFTWPGLSGVEVCGSSPVELRVTAP